ncbi:MAG: DUF455 family protein, partial [Myxococcota bacterium]
MRAFAERVLFGVTLADKLGPPDAIDDGADGPGSDRGSDAPGPAIAVPDAPGRPDGLALRSAARGGGRSVPGPGALADDAARGRVLHAFVNHELLALELFALAVLRFPDADPRLRRAWVATAADEQRHLRLYLERMDQCGVALGTERVSALFWDALAPIDDPVTFTVGIGLVLEQANLDFSRQWQAAFAAAGDPATAAVLAVVYEDEIRHVRVAARALQRDLRPGESLWDGFRRRLVFPLSPVRAKGPVVDRAGRLRAGLDDAFVDALIVTGGPKDRDPRVFVLDPHAEDDLGGWESPTSPVSDDLAALPVVLAHAGDVVVAPRPSI